MFSILNDFLLNKRQQYQAATAALELFDTLATIAKQDSLASDEQNEKCLQYLARVQEISPKYLTMKLENLLHDMEASVNSQEELKHYNVLRKRLRTRYKEETLLSQTMVAKQGVVLAGLLSAGVDPNTDIVVIDDKNNSRRWCKPLDEAYANGDATLGVLAQDKRTQSTKRYSVQQAQAKWKSINHHRLKTVVCKTLAKRIICLKASTNIRKSGNYLLCGDVLDPRYKPVPLAHLSCQLLPHNILYPTYADPNNVFSNEQIPSVTFYYFFL